MIRFSHLNPKGSKQMTATINRDAVKEQIKALEKKLAEDTKNKQKGAIKQVKAIIAEFGLTASQCGFAGTRKAKDPNAPAKTKAEPKYQFVNDKGAIVYFRGKGRIPTDLENYLKKNKMTLAEFEKDKKHTYIKPAEETA